MNSYNEQILQSLVKLLINRLNDIANVPPEHADNFIYGEQITYLKCLRYIKNYDKNNKLNLDFNITERYPIVWFVFALIVLLNLEKEI